MVVFGSQRRGQFKDAEEICKIIGKIQITMKNKIYTNEKENTRNS
jgi:hypothetical protein